MKECRLLWIYCFGLVLCSILASQETQCEDLETRETCQKSNCEGPSITSRCRKTCNKCNTDSGSTEDQHSVTKCDTGKIKYHGKCICKPGFYGEDCLQPCHENCKETKGTDSKCNGDNGHCHECESQWFGFKCDQKCSVGCENSCARNGTCKCRDGYYGLKCDQKCSKNCQTNSCNVSTGFCFSCKTGFYGNFCNMSCPNNCNNSAHSNMSGQTCRQQGGSCYSCTDGYRGSYCNTNCSELSEYCTTCDQHNNSCSNCNTGVWGRTCKNPCGRNCLGADCHMNGTCKTGCVTGRWGSMCKRSCSVGCGDGCDRSYGTCNISISNCPTLDHCIASGRSGVSCTDECFAGWWGICCEKQCPHSCLSCNRTTGHCLPTSDEVFGGSLTLWEILPSVIIICCLVVLITLFVRYICKRRRFRRMKIYNTTLISHRQDHKHHRAVINPSYVQTPKGPSPAVSETLERRPLIVNDPNLTLNLESSHVVKGPQGAGLTSPNILDQECRSSSCHSAPTPCPAGIDIQPDIVWSTEVPVGVFRDYVHVRKRNEDLVSQFFDLPYGQLGPCDEASKPENVFKNRYRNILPYDHSRVKLCSIEHIPGTDYINANYINGYAQPTAFIATQDVILTGHHCVIYHLKEEHIDEEHPKESGQSREKDKEERKFESGLFPPRTEALLEVTEGPYGEVIWDFWRMVWETRTCRMVMLTNLVENRKAKCEQYWPNLSEGNKNYDGVLVQCVTEAVSEEFTVRTFTVTMEGHVERTIQQFHYTAWPDKGVPRDVTSLVQFHNLVKNSPPEIQGPILVHCSAGVGRTGTFIALDYLIGQAEAEGVVDVYECVVRLRHQRMDLIQTEAQYVFLHDVLVNVLCTN